MRTIKLKVGSFNNDNFAYMVTIDDPVAGTYTSGRMSPPLLAKLLNVNLEDLSEEMCRAFVGLEYEVEIRAKLLT